MELLVLWERRRVQFEQCMELQLFNRDCEHANATMTKQEVSSFLWLSVAMLMFFDNLHKSIQ